MRPKSIASVQYAPDVPPQDASEMGRFLYGELVKIQAAINALAVGHLDQTTVAPTKPRDGDLRYASGAPNWNPGSGQGIYAYYASAWHFLG